MYETIPIPTDLFTTKYIYMIYDICNVINQLTQYYMNLMENNLTYNKCVLYISKESIVYLNTCQYQLQTSVQKSMQKYCCIYMFVFVSMSIILKISYLLSCNNINDLSFITKPFATIHKHSKHVMTIDNVCYGQY